MAHDPIQRLVNELSMLPGIGERTALRLALHLLSQKKERVISLAESLTEMAENVVECRICCNLTAYSHECGICQKPQRDQKVLCVVSCIQDLMAIEASASFRGVYHVLHGVLAPIHGIGPEQLRLKELNTRFNDSGIEEVIIATPSSIEGEATALYIREQMTPYSVRVSRIASGIPVGGDLQFTDRLSLARALMTRQNMM